MTFANANKDQWFLGSFIHAPNLGSMEVLQDSLIHVDAKGTIVSIKQRGDEGFDESIDYARQNGSLESMTPDHIMIPGLIDLHVHAPQWPQIGKGLHLPLQDWLQKFTFPLEARYSDIEYARCVYSSLANTLLINGTTTAMYFATIHEEATTLLASTCLELGQRAFVGRVAMDDKNQCPDYYRDVDAHAALAASERSINHIRQLPGNQAQRVKPVITPRFIPSCSNELLEGLGKLASQYHCHVQTHCSESDWEHDYVIKRFAKTDAQALSDYGLLNRHTVLAHANFISEQDMQLIKLAGGGIAHCALSNSYFADSVFPLRRALDKSLRIGLGTDIGGGHSASMLNACQQTISSSRMLETGVDTRQTAVKRGTMNSRINFIDAFHLATAGGATVLDCPTGVFSVGRQFDALLLDLSNPFNRLNEFTEVDDWEALLAKVIYNAQPCNISNVWVSGRRIRCLDLIDS